MRKVIIKEISGNNYTLIDNLDNCYILNILFYSKYKPVVNDIIYLNEKILDENNLFVFDDIKSDKKDLDNMIKIIHKKNEYYLQRIFG